MNQQPIRKQFHARDVHRELLGERNYSFSYVLGEAWEVIEALWKRDIKEAKEELRQVWYGLQMQYYQLTGHNIRLRGCNDCVQSFFDRRKVWKKIFRKFGEEFSSDYLKNGSNYMRPHKIQAALGLAHVHITLQHAERLAKQIAKGKFNK